jgi:hypothetical protein
MTTLNFNRPHFKRTEIWQRFDQYLRPGLKPLASGTVSGPSPKRSKRLDPFLDEYSGNDSVLLEAKMMRARCSVRPGC